ncbi:MAG: hypothetical protein WEC81_00835 [Patescibacteria group bacterium]
MKRFTKVYLTLLIVTIIVANLALVLIYGQQFLFSANSDNVIEGVTTNNLIIGINLIVLVIFWLFWLIAQHYYRQSKINMAKDVG